MGIGKYDNEIRNNLKRINTSIPPSVELIAVSKFHPAEAIQEAYEAGQRKFGESKMQELDHKHKILPNDIEWHFIGHLQRNKVKSIIPCVHTIHSVDSVRLFEEIAKQAAISQKKICCLLQIYIAKEESKQGFSVEECLQFLDSMIWTQSEYAYIGGVMGMATNSENEDLIRTEFGYLKQLFSRLKTKYFANTDSFKEISMGMSNDYRLAIEEGSTMIRVGSSVFGNREY